MPGRPKGLRWWHRGIVYHIYPRSLDPRFGTLDDFDTLLGEAHRRGLKLLLD